MLDEPGRDRLVANIADSLKHTAPHIQERTVKNFAKVDPDMANALRHLLCQEADATSTALGRMCAAS